MKNKWNFNRKSVGESYYHSHKLSKRAEGVEYKNCEFSICWFSLWFFFSPLKWKWRSNRWWRAQEKDLPNQKKSMKNTRFFIFNRFVFYEIICSCFYCFLILIRLFYGMYAHTEKWSDRSKHWKVCQKESRKLKWSKYSVYIQGIWLLLLFFASHSHSHIYTENIRDYAVYLVSVL